MQKAQIVQRECVLEAEAREILSLTKAKAEWDESLRAWGRLTVWELEVSEAEAEWGVSEMRDSKGEDFRLRASF